jgi:hypothetical protein
MTLDTKLQLKSGQTIAIIAAPLKPALTALQTGVASADAVLVYSHNRAKLIEQLSILQFSASTGKLTWVAYPKAGQLQTDLNRDLIRAIANDYGLDPIRQIAIDNIWSALRLKALPSD